jgi:phosphopantothenoylcysteine decarboxylase/phosphopantothenate--cysteine ligase
MSEPDVILDAARYMLGRRGSLSGKRVLVTAGGTREPLDPIRFLGNRSSGQMGYSLALAARDRGAKVTLISTTGQPAPFGCRLVPVETAAEMRDAVMAALPDADALLMAAAVADYRPATVATQKIKKAEGRFALELERTADILLQVAEVRREGQVVVGFAAETEGLVENALGKLQRKRLDLIVANDARQAMGAAANQVTLIGRDGHPEELPLLSKDEAAGRILDRVVCLLGKAE